jgi:ligand-binding sensor domain-containing protein
LARRGSERPPRPAKLAVIAAAYHCNIAANPPAATAQAATAESLLNAARVQLSSGDAQGALDTLRRLRGGFPDSPLLPDSDALNVQCSLALADIYKARYFAQRLTDSSPGSRAAFTAVSAVARYYYDSRQWLSALEYFTRAVDLFQENRSGTRLDRDVALLHAAELSAYRLGDDRRARLLLARISGRTFPPAESVLYRQLRVRLLWSLISAKDLGLKDANVSAMKVDGDDLWVGTWNGGVSRYSLSAGSSDPFPDPQYSRSIEAADRRVWVGTAEGLSWYGKGTARWGAEADPGADHPWNVQAVRSTATGLYIGTLGDGLLKKGEGGWVAVEDGSLPGRFVTSIAEDSARGRLLIGTLNIGVVIMDLTSGQMAALSELVPSFTTENITTILAARDGRVWIGTYGEGLAVWSPEAGKVARYTRDSGGEIADNWILSSCETDRALYFGSFGGGVSVLSKADGSWKHLGIRDGLASLDVPAIAWRAPRVFFGTLGGGVSVYDEDEDGALP